MDAHLIRIPRLGTLTARSLTGGDLQSLGGQTDGALDTQVLALGALEDLGAHLLEDINLAGGEGDADLVGFLFDVSWDAWWEDCGRKRTGASPISLSALL